MNQSYRIMLTQHVKIEGDGGGFNLKFISFSPPLYSGLLFPSHHVLTGVENPPLQFGPPET